MTTATVRLEHVVARNMRRLRLNRNWTQSDLAHEMRCRGMPWRTNRVAQIETLRRPTSLLETLALGWTFGVALAELFEGDEQIEMRGDAVADLDRIRRAFTT